MEMHMDSIIRMEQIDRFRSGVVHLINEIGTTGMSNVALREALSAVPRKTWDLADLIYLFAMPTVAHDAIRTKARELHRLYAEIHRLELKTSSSGFDQVDWSKAPHVDILTV
jgi:hypothetical protein